MKWRNALEAAWWRAGLACMGLVLVTACAKPSPSSIRLAMDGPDLVLAGELEGRAYEGRMERHAMAGSGSLSLHEQGTGVVCQGGMDSPASRKGRLYAELVCTDGRNLYLVLRNLGPDQGMGVGRFEGQSGRMTLFYHPCAHEAGRRLEQLRSELDGLDAAAKNSGTTDAAAHAGQ